MNANHPKSSLRVALALAALIVLVFAGCTNARSTQSPTPTSQPLEATEVAENAGDQQQSAGEGSTTVEIPHLHGLGFSSDGLQLIIPAHDGLRIYQAGKWSIPDVPSHDYMGYAPSSDGFYSSGHPHPASGLVNPFGLIKSTDGGQTVVNLGFTGETDFHLMAVGYQNHAIYVGNPEPNSSLSAGIHYSLDDGQTWQQSTLDGLTGQVIQIAVHPTNASVVALATEDGALLSTDFGDSFNNIGDGEVVTAVSFHSDGQSLLFGFQALSSYDLASQQSVLLSSPTITPEDAINYIAVNPVQPDIIALATFNKTVYLTYDGGKTWTLIVEAGKAL